MNERIADIAADPLQYDRDELVWTNEGTKYAANRQLYLEALRPLLGTMSGESVLDIGCGQGWLCHEVSQHGGRPLGLEPSSRNVNAAHDSYPQLRFVQASLQEFTTDKQFDSVLAIMVLEHFLDLEAAFTKIVKLLKPSGRFVTIVGDFDKFTRGRREYPFETEPLGPGEVATRTDYGERAGVLCDINRTVGRYVQVAKQTGLTLQDSDPILPAPWHPRYNTHKDKPLFHLLKFAK